MSVGYHPEGKGHHREPSRPKTIVFGVDAGDVDRRADTPSIGQPVTLSAKWRDILIAVWRPQSVHS